MNGHSKNKTNNKTTNMKDLKVNTSGKVAFVSGANRGIGKAITIELLERGAKKVYAGARNTANLLTLQEMYPERLIPVQLDVTNNDSIANAVKVASDVEILVNNAGLLIGDSIFSVEALDNFKSQFDVNVMGLVKLSQGFISSIKTGAAGGSIVNISSMAGLGNMPVIGSYSASKAAVHSIIQAMRGELSQDKVSVIGVYPGPIDTDMAKGFEMDKDSPENVARNIVDGIENGIEDVFPDQMSQQLKAVYMTNPKAIETEFGAYVAAE